jgi:hypothetical protein
MTDLQAVHSVLQSQNKEYKRRGGEERERERESERERERGRERERERENILKDSEKGFWGHEVFILHSARLLQQN